MMFAPCLYLNFRCSARNTTVKINGIVAGNKRRLPKKSPSISFKNERWKPQAGQSIPKFCFQEQASIRILKSYLLQLRKQVT